MDSFFTELGRTVLARWKAVNFSLAAFPQIAQEALEERPPSENVDVSELIREFLLNDEQPFQTQSGFGQPELVVYDDPRFYIQILFWLEGTTDIHQHMFSGAFHVLQGSSIHSHFRFEDAQPISSHIQVGQLRMTDTQLLETGTTVQIVSGTDCIHALFHLDTPSLTVVVRTHTDPGTGPQFTYLPPHLAVDPFHSDALTTRRKQLLDVLEKTGDPGYGEIVAEMLQALDFERGFFILQNCAGHLRTRGEWEEAWEIFAEKHGVLAEFVEPTLEEIVRRDALVEMRVTIDDPEHRFFLALLLNLQTRADILTFVGQRFPGDPAANILRWAEELTETSEVGTWLLDAQFPEEIELPLEEQSEALLSALAAFIAGEKSFAGADPEDVEALRNAFERSSLRALLA
ncbi:MAG: hypothetical protein ACO1QR_02185 [Chthoniobacteraceae bacterium]